MGLLLGDGKDDGITEMAAGEDEGAIV